MRALRRDHTGRTEPTAASEESGPGPDAGEDGAGTVSDPVLSTDGKTPAGGTHDAGGNGRKVWVTRVLVVLALLLVGGGLTYLLAPPVAAPQKLVTVESGDLGSDADAEVSPMPSLAGLSRETAQLVLRDAGAGDAEVSTSTSPAAGPPGLVLEQTPAPGSEIGATVSLVLSTPMRTPKVAGQALGDAQAQLQQLGAVVRVTQVIKPGAKAGQVLSSDPAAGATLPVVVTLRVADPGVSMSLADLGENDSANCSSDYDVTVAGTTAPSAVICDVVDPTYDEEGSYAAYRLGRRPLALTFTPGRSDEYGPGTGTIRILGDGKQLGQRRCGRVRDRAEADHRPDRGRVAAHRGRRALRRPRRADAAGPRERGAARVRRRHRGAGEPVTRRHAQTLLDVLVVAALLGLLCLLAASPAASGAASGSASGAAPAASAVAPEVRVAELVDAADTDDGGLRGYAPVMVVLDTSGSMTDPADAQDGEAGLTKIQAARAAVVNVAGALSSKQTFGLLSYPGTGADVDAEGCSRGGVNIGLGTPDAEQTSSVVSGLQADGGTPTSPALENAAEKLAASGARHSVIVLVSDGMANCGPPVCETAKKIRAQGVELTVNTVGFDVDTDPEAREDLRCVADATGGSYVDAEDAQALRDALQKAAASYLTVEAQVPDTLSTAEGQGTNLGTKIPVTVTNSGQQVAPDVRLSLDFLNKVGTGGALLVPRPIRFLGNIDPGGSREVTMEVRPAPSTAGSTFRWVVTATTSDGAGTADFGSTKVVDSKTALGSVFSEVKGTVAVLGDSYSSGEGAGVDHYQAGTYVAGRPPQCSKPVLDLRDIPPECRTGPKYNMCHRSDEAYGPALFGVKRTEIIACSGAVTGHVDVNKQTSGLEEMPLQLEELKKLTERTDVGAVLMTLGGNDIEFGPLAQACAASSGCQGYSGNAPIGQKHVDLVRAMGASLWRVYSKIDAVVNASGQVMKRGGKTAPIVVLPYVRILPRTPTESCLAGLSKEETKMLNGIISSLNQTIAAVVKAKVDAGRPFYLATDVEDAFLPAHTMCAAKGEQWANTARIRKGTQLPPPGEIIQLAHPNVAGYAAEARALAGWSASAKVIKAKPLVGGETILPTWLQKLFRAPGGVGDFVPSNANVALSGDGFAPDSPVSVFVASVKQSIGLVYADGKGSVDARVRLPAGLSPGRHHVSMVGFGGPGIDGARTVEKTVWVTGAYGWLAVAAILAGAGLLSWAAVSASRRRRLFASANGQGVGSPSTNA